METDGQAETSPTAVFFSMPVEASFKRTTAGRLAVYPWPWPVQVGCVLPDEATGVSLRQMMTLWLWMALPAFILIGTISPHALLPLGSIYVATYYLRMLAATRGWPRIAVEPPDETVRQNEDKVGALIDQTRYDESAGGYMQLKFVRSSLGFGKDADTKPLTSGGEWGGVAVSAFRLAGLALLALVGLWVASFSGDPIGFFLGLVCAAFFVGCAYPALRPVRSKSIGLAKVSEWQARRAVLMSAAREGWNVGAEPTLNVDDYDGDVTAANGAPVYRPRTRTRAKSTTGTNLPLTAPAPTGARRMP
jgi:hypothetical protein